MWRALDRDYIQNDDRRDYIVFGIFSRTFPSRKCRCFVLRTIFWRIIGFRQPVGSSWFSSRVCIRRVFRWSLRRRTLDSWKWKTIVSDNYRENIARYTDCTGWQQRGIVKSAWAGNSTRENNPRKLGVRATSPAVHPVLRRAAGTRRCGRADGARWGRPGPTAVVVVVVVLYYYYYKGGFRLYLHAGVVLPLSFASPVPHLPPGYFVCRPYTHGAEPTAVIGQGKPAAFPRRRDAVFTPLHPPTLHGFPVDRVYSPRPRVYPAVDDGMHPPPPPLGLRVVRSVPPGEGRISWVGHSPRPPKTGLDI